MLLPNKVHLARTNRLRYECLLERVNRGPCPVRRDGLRTGLDKGVLVRRQVSGQCQCSVKEKGNQGPQGNAKHRQSLSSNTAFGSVRYVADPGTPRKGPRGALDRGRLLCLSLALRTQRVPLPGERWALVTG